MAAQAAESEGRGAVAPPPFAEKGANGIKCTPHPISQTQWNDA